MQKSKLFNLLKALSEAELAKFRDFYHSPFFNKNKKVIKLGDLILSYSPNIERFALSKKEVYPLIFGESSYKDLQLNNIISDLLQLLYEFLGQLQLKGNTQLQKQLLLDDLLDRNAEIHIDRVARRFKNLQQKSPYRNHTYFYQEHLFYEKQDQSVIRHAKRSFDKNLQLQSDNLDLYYFSNKLRMACDMTSRNIVIQAGYHCDFLPDLLNYIEKNHRDFQSIPAINIYYQVLQLIQHNQSNDYQSLKSALIKHQTLFPKLELWNLYKYVINFCIKKINSGESQFYQELLDVYKVLLENRIIFPNGYLSQWTFKNIITVSSHLEAFEWTEDFIRQYETFIHPEDRFNAITYNKATLYNAQGNFQAALQTLHNVEFTDSSYHLGAKIIQLKCYYELEETEALYALIEAFRKYLLRNKDISDYRKKANNNMLKIVKGIYQLKINRASMTTSAYNQKKRNINSKFEQLNPIANKDWLEEIYVKGE